MGLIENQTTLSLGMRLGEISKERSKIGANQELLDIEHDLIVAELVRRYPHLKDDVDLQPKKRVRRRYENNRMETNKRF